MTKYITFERIFWVLVVLFLLYWAGCRKPQPSIVKVPSPTEQIEKVIHDSVASQKYKDSVTNLINKYYVDATNYEQKYNSEKEYSKTLEQGMDDLFAKNVPDTCKAIVAQLQAQYQKVSISSRAQQNACEKAVMSLRSASQEQERLIAKSAQDYSLLRRHFDAAMIYQTTLSKQLKQLKPKHSIGAGVFGEANYTLPYTFAAGLQVYYRDRKGTQLSLGVLTNQRVQLGISKNLFNF